MAIIITGTSGAFQVSAGCKRGAAFLQRKLGGAPLDSAAMRKLARDAHAKRIRVVINGVRYPSL